MSVSGFGEFQSIAPRIAGVEAADVSDGFVPCAADAGVFEGRKRRVDIFDRERGVRLGGGPEILFNADVELARADFEPTSAARSESFRLFDFLQPQNTAEKLARRGFASARSGDLHVVDIGDSHERNSMHADSALRIARAKARKSSRFFRGPEGTRFHRIRARLGFWQVFRRDPPAVNLAIAAEWEMHGGDGAGLHFLRIDDH